MNKTSLTTLRKVICRTPVFSLDCIFENEWEFLKQLIKDSSPDFYRLIKDFNISDVPEQPFKTRYTIWKYWNRAKYRATPFNQFAALTLLPLKSSVSGISAQVTREMTYSKFVSWKNKDNLILTPTEERHHASYFVANTSFYVVGSEIRYIYNDDGVFQLTSVELQDTILQILQYCTKRRTREDLYLCLFKLLQFNETEIDELIKQLIDIQLLLTDRHPNIIGSDYFERIGYQLINDTNIYVIGERKLVAGGVPISKFDNLKKLIHFLVHVLPVSDNGGLAKFKRNFLKRFEHRLEVPLLEALDPEVGVGYLTLDNLGSDRQLVNEILSFTGGNSGFPERTYSDLHKFLLNNLASRDPIYLEQMEFNDRENLSNYLPNTFSAIVQVTEDLVIAKQIGGITAAALMGRFTLLNDDLELFGKEITAIEEKANPDVLFFDIAYQSDIQVDDVNRRKKLYTFELPILTWSEGLDTLDLNDIMVAVIDNQILLRSKKLNRRVVPRLATAYNYNRSELSVFRFLSDLQHQGFQTNLTLNVEELLPYLTYYPRIMYKDVVVSPSKWLIPEQLYKKAQSESQGLSELKKWLVKNEIEQPFLCGSSDQKLCFDPLKDEELLFFLQFVRSKKDMYIEESFSSENKITTDEAGRPYFSEFMVSFGHEAPIYNSYQSSKCIDKNLKSINRDNQFMQGSEWLYLKIYCHPNRSEELLLIAIRKVVDQYKMKIKNWFYIRYLDPDYHIRLRIQLKDRIDFSFLLDSFQSEFQSYVNEETIQDIQLAIYNREIERYGINSIDEIEDIFGLDSKFSLQILQERLSIEALYTISIELLIGTMEKTKMSLKDQRTFVKKMATIFSNEHKLSPTVYKKINNHFNIFYETYSNLYPINPLKKGVSKLSDEYSRVLLKYNGENRTKLLADIFHMHVNRLYVENQRIHELIIYEFTWKVFWKVQ